MKVGIFDSGIGVEAMARGRTIILQPTNAIIRQVRSLLE